MKKLQKISQLPECNYDINNVGYRTLFYVVRRCQCDLHINSGVIEVISLVHCHNTKAAFTWQLLNQLKLFYVYRSAASIQVSVMTRKSTCMPCLALCININYNYSGTPAATVSDIHVK